MFRFKRLAKARLKVLGGCFFKFRPKALAPFDSSVLVVVANYGFSKNADRLKKLFSRYFHTYLVDSSSPSPPKFVDLIIPNTYYPGLWNAAVDKALSSKFEWLFFLASDVTVMQVKKLCYCIKEVSANPGVGVYTPSLTSNSRVAFNTIVNKKTNGIRSCHLVEGFAFLVRVNLLCEIYPVPVFNKYGWCLDIIMCEIARQKGYDICVDDRISIFHPTALEQHVINASDAAEEAFLYAKSLGYSEGYILQSINKANH